MARVRLTVPIAGGYPHREHRSKKGRRKKVFSEQKPPAYPVYLENDEQILKKNDRFKVMENPTEFKEALTLGDVLDDLPPIPKQKQGSYPKLACENCGYHNQLHFLPKKEENELSAVKCAKCKELAYFKFYWKETQLEGFSAFIQHSWMRELIKLGKATLLNLRNLW